MINASMIIASSLKFVFSPILKLLVLLWKKSTLYVLYHGSSAGYFLTSREWMGNNNFRSRNQKGKHVRSSKVHDRLCDCVSLL